MFYQPRDPYYDDFYFGYPGNNTYNLNQNNSNMPYDPYLGNNFNQVSYNDQVFSDDFYRYPSPRANVNSMNQNTNNVTHYQNYNHLYPSIYRILDPVVKKVVYSSGNTYLNDKILNELAEEVFNIVEGDINKSESDDQIKQEQSQINQTSQTQLQRKPISKDEIKEACMNIRNSLIKDFIKVLIINEFNKRTIYRTNNHLNVYPVNMNMY